MTTPRIKALSSSVSWMQSFYIMIDSSRVQYDRSCPIEIFDLCNTDNDFWMILE